MDGTPPRVPILKVGHWLDPAPWWAEAELRKRIKVGEFASPRVQAWRKQIEWIRTDLIDLQASRGLIEDLQKIVAANPRLQTWNFFLDRILRWYATSTLVLVHRELHRRRDVVSLVRLLEDIRQHPDELTRIAYRKLHSGRSDVRFGPFKSGFSVRVLPLPLPPEWPQPRPAHRTGC